MPGWNRGRVLEKFAEFARRVPGQKQGIRSTAEKIVGKPALGCGVSRRINGPNEEGMRMRACRIDYRALPSQRKDTNKEEFVTCGVCLKEVDFRTMESKLHKGLYFAGECPT